jgi:hypothetical protein
MATGSRLVASGRRRTLPLAPPVGRLPPFSGPAAAATARLGTIPLVQISPLAPDMVVVLTCVGRAARHALSPGPASFGDVAFEARGILPLAPFMQPELAFCGLQKSHSPSSSVQSNLLSLQRPRPPLRPRQSTRSDGKAFGLGPEAASLPPDHRTAQEHASAAPDRNTPRSRPLLPRKERGAPGNGHPR